MVFLVHPRTYDEMLKGGMTSTDMESRGLLRVSEDFLVIMLGLPVPPYPGNSLDPPLRSRLQGRVVANTSTEELYETITRHYNNNKNSSIEYQSNMVQSMTNLVET